ncbi:MAG: PspC domain-containing protein [Crocinitomicaceae bacterium]|nr:PspC domain-containing protein [Crocinitomicaceae bacterium]
MKKTVSVNIKGSNFLIEEDAYELLQDYLDRLKNALKNESGSKEIIEDVELRIAELCTEKLSEFQTVVEMEDIEDILNTLGDPSMYLDEDAEESTQEKAYEGSSNKSSERRLFRDTENAVIGGVCQGIANFMNIDVVVIRAIFLVILLFAGFGFPLYVILWIIVPKTKSTIDRLRMKGRPITVESVREEVESAAEKLKNKSNNFASNIRENENTKRRLTTLGRVLAISAGVILILWGLSWLVMFLIFIIGGFQFIPILSEDGMVSVTELGQLVLASPDDVTLAWFGLLLGGFSIILFLLLLGTSLIFRLRNRWMNLTLGGLFTGALIGGIICAYLGFKAGVDLTLEGEVEKEVATMCTDQLTLLPELNATETKSGFNVKSNGRNGIMKIGKKEIQMYGIDILYRESKDSLFHIHQNFSARAKSNTKGVKRAERIEHDIRMVGDSLYLDTDYRFPREDKIRDQRVLIIIDIPEGGTVLAEGREITFTEPEEGKVDEDEEDDDDKKRTRRQRKHGRFFGDGDYEHHHRHW